MATAEKGGGIRTNLLNTKMSYMLETRDSKVRSRKWNSLYFTFISDFNSLVQNLENWGSQTAADTTMNQPHIVLCWCCSCLYVVSDSFATPGTAARQGPLSMGFPRQEHWSRLPFPPPGKLSNPGIKTASPAFADRFFTAELSVTNLSIGPSPPFPFGNCILFFMSVSVFLYCKWVHFSHIISII